MGQRDKAREVARAHEFTFKTTANAGEIIEVLKAAAQAAAPGGLKGSYKLVGAKGSKAGYEFVTEWEFHGPGGLVKVMDFTVSGEPKDGGALVRLDIGNFKYQKGAAFFMQPTLNGGRQLKHFGQIVTQQLSGQAV